MSLSSNRSILKSPWLPPLLGALGGILYEVVDENLLEGVFGITPPPVIGFMHGIVDFILPVLFGVLVGLIINAMRKQMVLNQYLSIQNTKLQRDLLVNTMTSLFLHEIRNPVHNIAAALEDSRVVLPDEIGVMVHRNLNRLNQTAEQYRKWSGHFENIDPKEKTELRPWLKEFIENKARPKLRELNIDYSQDVEALQVFMHPVLLDQSFTTLFSNACEALGGKKSARKLRLTAHLQPDQKEKIELRLVNEGSSFREDVLVNQGRTPIESKKGWGLGLTLLRKALEQAEVEIFLANREGNAEVKLLIPGESQ